MTRWMYRTGWEAGLPSRETTKRVFDWIEDEGLDLKSNVRLLFKLALENGVVDKSYSTVGNGWVQSATGRAEFPFQGRVIRANGIGPRGNAEIIFEQGTVCFDFAPSETWAFIVACEPWGSGPNLEESGWGSHDWITVTYDSDRGWSWDGDENGFDGPHDGKSLKAIYREMDAAVLESKERTR
jgi:hypothetical protein